MYGKRSAVRAKPQLGRSSICLQIAVIALQTQPELGERLPVSDRAVPPVTRLNGTLMARDASPSPCCQPPLMLVRIR